MTKTLDGQPSFQDPTPKRRLGLREEDEEVSAADLIPLRQRIAEAAGDSVQVVLTDLDA